MGTRSITLLLLAVSTASLLPADVTIRFENRTSFGVLLPQPISDRTRNASVPALPDPIIRYLKGTHEYLKAGTFACLMDYKNQTITLIDDEHKRYAMVPMKDYAAKVAATLPGLPSEYRDAAAAIKPIFSSSKTGRTDTVKGIPVEETEMKVLVDLPAPPGFDVKPALQLKLQIWAAKDAQDKPAIREWTEHAWPDPRFSHSIDPANTLSAILGAMPGLDAGLSQMLEEVEKSHAAVLKSHIEAALLGMAQGLKQLPAEQTKGLPKGLNPDAPFLTVDSEPVEILTTPVDDKVFQVPGEYKAAAFEEVFKAIAPIFPKKS